MSNQKLHLGLFAEALSSLMIFAVALPAANALTPRDFGYFDDRHTTDRFTGGQKVCGDKLCTAGEWSKMKRAMHFAERNPSECKELKNWKSCGSIAAEKPSTKQK